MSTTDLFFVAIAFFVGMVVCAILGYLYLMFKKAEPALLVKGLISGINKLLAFENKTPEALAKAAAEDAHMKALKDSLKDVAAKL